MQSADWQEGAWLTTLAVREEAGARPRRGRGKGRSPRGVSVCLSHLLNDSPSASWFGCLHPIFLCSLLGKVEESQELSSESDIFVQSEIY